MAHYVQHGRDAGKRDFRSAAHGSGSLHGVRVGYKAPRPESGVDYWLDIVYRLKEDKPYALRGFEAAVTSSHCPLRRPCALRPPAVPSSAVRNVR